MTVKQRCFVRSARWINGLSLFVLGFGILGRSVAIAQTTAADYRQMGLAYRQAGNFPEAIAALQEAVNLAPDDVNGRVLLGWTQHLAGDSDAAMQTLRDTVYLDPLSVETANALGIVYLVRNDLSDAVLVHTWAALLKSDNEIAYYNLSLAYEQMGRYDWAIATGERATELEPWNPHPWVALAIAHWSNGDVKQAQEIYRQAIAVDGRYTDAAFLDYLTEAAFSPEQIERAKTVLNAT
ncbi:MAG: tetratricopeptide repeat protein [Synechococcales cyanobacterium T60_A2020_003]|nr:tetratricopeptide repeat protein [Synechococcales cyanobacterium T60_A2020_003]